MNILTHVSAAIASTNALDAESESMLAFFGQAGRLRNGQNWTPRQRRRDRVRRRTA